MILRSQFHQYPESSNSPARSSGGAVSGQAVLLLVIFMLLGLLLVGVILELGHLLIARRQLQNDADAAAAYGAMQLDVDGLRLSNGAVVDVLSPGGSSPAGARISSFMAAAGYGRDEWNWDWGRCAMQINLSRSTSTVFFSSVGIKNVTVKASAKAKLSNSDNQNGCG